MLLNFYDLDFFEKFVLSYISKSKYQYSSTEGIPNSWALTNWIV